MVGLFGLDCEHDCRSEFHPVYALAIQLDENPNDNVWAMFVRNWGNEGFCSSLNHELNLTGQKMSLLLPWPGAEGLTGTAEQIYPPSSIPETSLLQDENGNGTGALVTFTLTSPSSRNLTEAVLHLHWKGGTGPKPRTKVEPPPQALVAKTVAEGEQTAEHGLGQLKATSGFTLPKEPGKQVQSAILPPSSAPVKLQIQKYRLSKPQPKPTALLTEAMKVPVECGGPSSPKPCPVDQVKRNRDIQLWKGICAGMKGNYVEEEKKYPGITRLCTDPRIK